MAKARDFAVTDLPGATLVSMLVFVALYAPILVLVIYSFNAGDSVAAWKGWSLDWYRAAWANDEVKAATWVSLQVAVGAEVL